MSRDLSSSLTSFGALPVTVTWFAAAAVASAVVMATVYVIIRLYIKSSSTTSTARVAQSSALYYRCSYRQDIDTVDVV